jgi:hypothetical protein
VNIKETARKLAQNKWVWIGAAGVVGAIMMLRSKSGAADSSIQVVTSFKPAAIGANELVSANKYRLIESRRSGMNYVPVSKGGLGGTIEFTSASAGKFTWNVIQEGGSILAEVSPT